MALADTDRSFSFGNVVSLTFGVIGRNLATFVVLSLIASVPSVAFSLFSTVSTRAVPVAVAPQAPVMPMFSLSAVLIALAGFLILMMFAFTLQAAMIFGTIADLNGRRASIGECIATGLRAVPGLLVITILYVLGIWGASILLVVPGIMLAVAWAVVVPAYVVERGGILASFGRSLELTRGHRWSIFGLYFVYLMAVFALLLATGPITGSPLFGSGLGTGSPALGAVFALVLGTAEGIVSAAGTASIYYLLRASKEGIGPSQLAEVFA